MSDELRRGIHERLKWVIVGSGPALRPEADSRTIIDWIERAIEAQRTDADSFEAGMLTGLLDGMFTVDSIADGQLSFALTERGRGYVDSMPHHASRLTKDGIK